MIARQAGQGPAVVVVHDVPDRCPQFARIGLERRQVLHPELPGFGRSDKPPAGLHWDDLADLLVEWLGASGLPTAALVGHGAGSVLALAAAWRWEKPVSAVITVPRGAALRARSVARFARGHIQTRSRLARGEGQDMVRRDAAAWLEAHLADHRVVRSFGR